MQYDVIIVGGGAVGLATALQLKTQNQNLKVVVIEKEPVVINHQTENNSNVIHSGIYYTPGAEAGIKFDDPSFAIEWPTRPTVVSDKEPIVRCKTITT